MSPISRTVNPACVPIGGGPSDYAANIKSEIAKWAPVIKAANIKAE